MKKIIGLVGGKGAGKTSVAFRLRARHEFVRMSISDTMKDMIYVLPGVESTNITGNQKEEPIEKLGGVTARHLLQTLGTEWGRVCIGEDFWLDIWQRKIEHIHKVVVDDVRFVNEAERIKELGGKIIRVEREDALLLEDEHASEQVHKKISVDYTINNSFTNLNDLYDEVDKMMEQLEW